MSLMMMTHKHHIYRPSSASLWCADVEDAGTTGMHPVCWLGQ